MPTERLETIEQFVLDGPITPGQAIGLGVVLALVSAWTIWLACRRDRRWLAPVLWTLRLGAIAVVLWMLLGATNVTILRRTIPKSVAILVDRSASMGVVDPAPSKAAALRWGPRNDNDRAGQLLAMADRAATATTSAHSQFLKVLDILRRSGKAETVEHALTVVSRSSGRAETHLKVLSKGLSDREARAHQHVLAARQLLRQTVLPTLEEMIDDVQSGDLVMDAGRDAQVQELARQLAGAASRAERVVRELEQQFDATPDRDDPQLLASYSQATRIEKVAQLLDAARHNWLEEVSRRVHVKTYAFRESVAPLASGQWKEALSDNPGHFHNPIVTRPDPPQAGTNLSAALQQVTRDATGVELAAAVLLTDGQHNQGRDPRQVAAAMADVPVHIVPVGNTQQLRDVMLHHVQAPRAVIESDNIVVEAMITAYGCDGEELIVEFREGEQVIESQQITAAGQRSDHRLAFATQASGLGRHSYTLHVEPLTEEHTVDNNKAELHVEVTEDQIRVLVADDLPRWELRYLVNLFRRDPHVEHEKLTFRPKLEGTGKLAARPQFPQDVSAWSRYRVVILGDVPPKQLTPSCQEALKQHVIERGGTLILIAGERAMPHAYADQPLAGLLPVEPARSSIRRHPLQLYLTAEGRQATALHVGDDPVSSERIWQAMAQRMPIYAPSPFLKPKPTSHVLIGAMTRLQQQAGPAERVQQAFLSWHDVGRGRVVYLAAPVTYHLRFRKGDEHHHRFWGQLIRWAVARDLAGGFRTVRLSTDKTRYEVGEDVQVHVRLQQLDGDALDGAKLTAEVQQDDRTVASIELVEDERMPGTYAGTFSGLKPGYLTVRAVGPVIDDLLSAEGAAGPVQTPVIVDPAVTAELRNTQCNLPLLEQITAATGGQVVPPTALSEVFQTADLSPRIVDEQPIRAPLWNQWKWLWVFIGCLCTEWIVRKWAGLM